MMTMMSGGGGGPRCGNATYEISGSISGIDGSHYFGVILVNDAQSKVTTVQNNGAFALSDSTIPDKCYAAGYEYDLSIYQFAGGESNQPYICDITNGVGIVDSRDITNIVVSCQKNLSYTADPLPPLPSQCKTYSNASIYPSLPSQYECGPVDSVTQSIMNDINSFWGSQMYLCSCRSDQPNCLGNAVVYGSAPSHQGYGYIYYDSNFLVYLNNISNTLLTPAWLLSHEAGHNVQSEFSATFPTQAIKELSADCLSGYFLGNLICNGQTNKLEIDSVLNTLCTVDNGQSAFFNPNGHGSCQERVSYISAGINSYLNGIPPLDACF